MHPKELRDLLRLPEAQFKYNVLHWAGEHFDLCKHNGELHEKVQEQVTAAEHAARWDLPRVVGRLGRSSSANWRGIASNGGDAPVPEELRQNVSLTGCPQFGNTNGLSSEVSAPPLPTPRWCDNVKVSVATLSTTGGLGQPGVRPGGGHRREAGRCGTR